MHKHRFEGKHVMAKRPETVEFEENLQGFLSRIMISRVAATLHDHIMQRWGKQINSQHEYKRIKNAVITCLKGSHKHLAGLYVFPTKNKYFIKPSWCDADKAMEDRIPMPPWTESQALVVCNHQALSVGVEEKALEPAMKVIAKLKPKDQERILNGFNAVTEIAVAKADEAVVQTARAETAEARLAQNEARLQAIEARLGLAAPAPVHNGVHNGAMAAGGPKVTVVPEARRRKV